MPDQGRNSIAETARAERNVSDEVDPASLPGDPGHHRGATHYSDPPGGKGSVFRRCCHLAERDRSVVSKADAHSSGVARFDLAMTRN